MGLHRMDGWWDHYLDGKIVIRPETPQSIITTMKEWHNGPRCPMRRFVLGDPVKPHLLRRAIAKACAENRIAIQDAPLKALQVWAVREAALAEAASRLQSARQDFNTAAETVGFDSVRDLIAVVDL